MAIQGWSAGRGWYPYEEIVSEAWVKEIVKNMLEDSNAYYFMPPSNGYGRGGIPDFIGCIDGLTLGIEAKKSQGGKLSALQERELNLIDKHDGLAIIVDEYGLPALRKLLYLVEDDAELGPGIRDLRKKNILAMDEITLAEYLKG